MAQDTTSLKEVAKSPASDRELERLQNRYTKTWKSVAASNGKLAKAHGLVTKRAHEVRKAERERDEAERAMRIHMRKVGLLKTYPIARRSAPASGQSAASESGS